MKKHYLLFSLLAPILALQAQSPAIEWQNTIGGTSTEDMRSIAQTSDGGYILGAHRIRKILLIKPKTELVMMITGL
ncbi:MAG: hypothetical protein IPI65_17835 [Bacteroidetes bacterium]|nr:hypothetical protein [Bacteroidota bacterium]